MKNMLKCLITMVFLLSPLTLWAHANHGSFDPVDEGQASKVASKVVQDLVDNEKLAKSWKKIKPAKAENRKSERGPVWVVHFQNSDEKDAGKKDLYVYIDEFGNPLSVAHQGDLSQD